MPSFHVFDLNVTREKEKKLHETWKSGRTKERRMNEERRTDDGWTDTGTFQVDEIMRYVFRV